MAANSDDSANTIVGAVMIVLAIIAVSLRFYSRLHLKQQLLWDDWFVLMALIFYILAAVLVLVGSMDNPSTQWVDDSLEDLDYEYTDANKQYLMLNWIASIFYFFIVCPAKLSILFMYNRIFSISRSFRRCVYGMSVLVALYWAGNGIAEIFTCIPFRYSWESARSPAEYCFNSNIWWLANGIIEVIFDVVIICMPLGLVAKLHLSVRKRVGLAGVFLLGAFGIITGAVKVSEAYLPGKRSPSWGNTAMWATIHGGVGILCACLPILWRIMTPLTTRILTGTTSLRNLLTSIYHRTSRTASYARDTGHESNNDNTRDRQGPTDTELLAMPKQSGVDDIKSTHSRSTQSHRTANSLEEGTYPHEPGHNASMEHPLPHAQPARTYQVEPGLQRHK